MGLNMAKFIDMTGKTSGILKVISLDHMDKKHGAYWLCKCLFDSNFVIVNGTSLRNGHTTSCGCFARRGGTKKYNQYNLNGEYGIGIDSKNKFFYFDLEDYDKIKNYCWKVENSGYVTTTIKQKRIKFYEVVLDNYTKNLIDHKNRIRNDNRKENLRPATILENHRNYSINKNNTSGYIGVRYIRTEKRLKRWLAYIYVEGKEFKKRFNKLEDAIIWRLSMEKIYFKDFSPQKHLFNEYGIK
jgi:hypothetical protein